MTVAQLIRELQAFVRDDPACKKLPVHLFSDPEGNAERGVYRVTLAGNDPTSGADCLLIIPDDTLHGEEW